MIKGIVNKNSNRFYIFVNILFHYKWRKVIPSGTRVLEGCDNISYNIYILNYNTIINTIYINTRLTLQIIYFSKL